MKNKYQITEAWEDLSFGYAIAICELTDCIEMTDDFIQTIPKTEQECGDWKVGRYAWKLDNVRVLDNPIPIKGKQGLWNIELNSNLSLSSIKKKLYTNRYRDGQTLCSKNGENASLSISCLVKQPKQPEVKGIIQKDLGDRFVVEVDSEQISVSKLFVYPNFSKTVAQIPPSGVGKSRYD